MKKHSVLFVCISMFLMAAPLFAQEKNSAVVPTEDLDALLALTSAQKEKLSALKKDFVTRQKTVQDDIVVKRSALAQELDKESPNRKKAEGLINEINRLQGQIMLNNADQFFKTREVLTADQLKMFQKIKQDRKDAKNTAAPATNKAAK